MRPTRGATGLGTCLGVALVAAVGAAFAQPPAHLPDLSGLVDVHAHVGQFQGFDLSPATLLAELESHGVGLALVSNIDGARLPGVTGDLDETAANQALVNLLARNQRLARRVRPLAWGSPARPGAAALHLEPFLKDHGFVGVKLHPRFDGFDPAGSAADPYLELCRRHRVPLVIHCDRAGPIHELARRHPQVPVVLYHSGFGTDQGDAVATVKLSRQRDDADLYLETSQVRPDRAVAMVRAVGADRVLFGTDATYYGVGHYVRYGGQVEALRRELSAEDYGRVMGGNARRLFSKIGPAAR